jgi:serine/threonine protein phosphatase PrpC
MGANYSPQQNPQLQPRHNPQSVPVTVWGATDTGRQREGNEDAIFPHSGSEAFIFQPSSQHLAQKGQLLIVADGVGGAKGGREASHWAIRVAVERYYDMSSPDPGANLRAAVEAANASLYQYIQSTSTQEAGCTMAAAVIRGNTLYVANVGDSRVYLLRNRQITQLTRDHTLTQQKIDHGIIRPEEAETDSGSHVLIRSMGAAQTVQVDLFPPLRLAAGDVVLVCSDGLTNMLKDVEIARVIGDKVPKQAARRLIAAANRNGGVDNISVVLARMGEQAPAAGGSLLEAIRHMSRQQQIVLLGGAALVIAAVCLMASLSWWMYDRQESTPTPTLAATNTSTPLAATPTATPVTTEPPTESAPAGRPTSTPAPTVTPTNTPVPPTFTPTPTDTSTPEPTQPPPASRPGESEEQPTEPPPRPTKEPPPPPSGGGGGD